MPSTQRGILCLSMRRRRSAVILKTTPLGLVAEYVLFTSPFTPPITLPL